MFFDRPHRNGKEEQQRCRLAKDTAATREIHPFSLDATLHTRRRAKELVEEEEEEGAVYPSI